MDENGPFIDGLPITNNQMVMDISPAQLSLFRQAASRLRCRPGREAQRVQRHEGRRAGRNAAGPTAWHRCRAGGWVFTNPV